MMRARIALASGDLTATDEILAAAVGHNPGSVLLVQSHGNVLADLGRLGDSLTLLQTAASLSPMDPTVRVDVAAVHAAIGDDQAAYAELQRAEVLGANGPEFLELLALTQYRLGNVDAAREAAIRLTEEFPEYPGQPTIKEILQ